jgi:serine/threonine protein kinase
MLVPAGYQLLGYLGHGGFGTVHLVRGPGSGPQYAMKVIINTNDNEARDVMKEANLLKDLRHPNIVSLVAAPQHDFIVYLILEYCEKKDLYHYLNNLDLAGSSVSQKQTVSWLQDLAAGIHVSTAECVWQKRLVDAAYYVLETRRRTIAILQHETPT